MPDGAVVRVCNADELCDQGHYGKYFLCPDKLCLTVFSGSEFGNGDPIIPAHEGEMGRCVFSGRFAFFSHGCGLDLRAHEVNAAHLDIIESLIHGTDMPEGRKADLMARVSRARRVMNEMDEK